MAKKVLQGIPTQSFENMDPVTLDKVAYEGHATGLRLPDGSILAFPRINSHQGVARLLARALNAEIVVIKGTWKFIPDLDFTTVEDNEEDADQ